MRTPRIGPLAIAATAVAALTNASGASALTGAPVPPADTTVTLHNREVFVCLPQIELWGNVDASTLFHLKIMSGTSVVAQDQEAIPFPAGGDGRPGVRVKITTAHRVNGLRCEVMAENGSLDQATSTTTVQVRRALPEHRDPLAVLNEVTAFPVGRMDPPGSRSIRMRVTAAERAAGMRSHATRRGAIAGREDVRTWAAFFTSKSAALAYLGSGLCSRAREMYSQLSTVDMPWRLVSCRMVTVPNTRRVVTWVAISPFTRSDGTRRSLVQVFTGGVAGFGEFEILSTRNALPQNVTTVLKIMRADHVALRRQIAYGLAME